MKVAWLGPYDINSIQHRFDTTFDTSFHPATWIKNGAQALVKSGDVELHLLMHDKRFPKDYRFVEQGIHFHLFHTPFPRVPRPLALYQLDCRNFYRELAGIQPDIVHGHGTENLFSYVAITSGYPNIVSVQAIVTKLIKEHKGLSRRLLEHLIVQYIERYTVKRAKNFIIKAPFVEHFIKELNPGAVVHLLENIIHERFFQVERKPGVHRRKILFIGSLINTKGIEELIHSFTILASEFADIELHLVGTGIESYTQSVLMPLIKNGMGKDRIVMHGHVSTDVIAQLFSESAMVVLPSYYDTSPNSVAEAMVAGVPVIGTDVGGIPFMIQHGETGTVIPSRNVRALTDAMRSYIEHPERAERYAGVGRDRARLRFGEQRYVDRLLTIYRSIVETGQRKKNGM